MDAFSHADSGDSSPHSAEAAADETHHQPAPEPAPAPPARVRLMVSYGGRIQPRPHDNQLSYVNGETKILSMDRPLRFADFAARLAALAGAAGEVCVKYQLPGEDLDALVSVTNDEDLDHLVLEFDRLHLVRPPAGSGGSSRGGSATPRLRVFLFPVHPPPPPPASLLEPKPERHWFVDALNSVPPPPPPSKKETQVAAATLQPAALITVTLPPPPPAVTAPTSPDYLFGLDNGFVPPPAVKVKDPAGEPPTARENMPVEIPAKEDRHINGGAAGEHLVVSPVVSPAELQRQIQELEKLQVTDNSQPPATATIPRNGSDETLARAYPPNTAAADYHLPKFPEKPPVPPPSSAPQAFLPMQGSFMPGRYTSVAASGGGDHAPFFFIPATHGYYAAAPGGASYPAVYAVAPPPAPTNVVRQTAADAANVGRTDNTNAAAYAPQVAYDSTGRAVYYTSVLPPYPAAMTNVAAAAALGTEAAKPVKPTAS